MRTWLCAPGPVCGWWVGARSFHGLVGPCGVWVLTLSAYGELGFLVAGWSWACK